MSKQITLQKYCVECGRVSGRISFGGTYAFHFWCWLRWLWRGLTKRAVDALRSDNIRNIRPPKYAPGDKRGKNARR